MVGVHQHYFGPNTYLPAFLLVSDIQAGQGEVMPYLAEMGIDPMIMVKALITPPDDICILVPEEPERDGLSTSLTEQRRNRLASRQFTQEFKPPANPAWFKKSLCHRYRNAWPRFNSGPGAVDQEVQPTS